VQMPDGQWVETKPHDGAYSSISKWSHAEGEPFVDGRSPIIRLGFR
jgi:hypothetical protein